MYFDFTKKPRNHKIYFIGKYLAKTLSYAVYKKLTVKGKENIPKNGALIIVSNHIAFSDPAVIISTCPRIVHFMAKSDLFEDYFKSLFMRNMNAFPIKRNQSDRAALRRAVQILNNDWVLGIFPEGRRVKKSAPTELKKGAAYLARITGADVLPVCIYRSEKDDSVWHKLVLSYGKVIKNSEFGFENKNKADEISRASKMISKKITELWEAENEGYSS